MEADLPLGPAPAIPGAGIRAFVAAPQSAVASSSIIRAKVATPAVRQKCSKLAPTASQASVTIALASGRAGVVFLFMALLSIVDSTPRA